MSPGRLNGRDRLPEVNETVIATYLAGANTRRLRGALRPLLKAAPLSKSAVSRVVGTLKAELEAWRTRSLADFDVLGLYLDALALRVRSAGKVVSVPALGATSSGISSGRRRSTRSLRSGATSTGSSTPRAPPRPGGARAASPGSGASHRAGAAGSAR